LGGGPGPQHPAPDVEHRPAGAHDQLGCLTDLLAVRVHGRPVAGQVQGRRPGEPGHPLENVLGNVDQDRAGPARTGEGERLGEGRGRVLPGWYEVVVLGDRHGMAAVVAFREAFGPISPRGPLAGVGDITAGFLVALGVGVSRLVAPGPDVAMQTPTFPVAWA